MIALLLAGTIVLCGGILAIVFGIPIKEFSVGSTLILAGSVIASTGVLLIGLAMIVRELQQLTRRLDASLPAAWTTAEVPEVVVATVPSPAIPSESHRSARRSPGHEDFLFPRDQPEESPSLDELDMPLPPLQPGAPQWSEPPAPERPVRERGLRDPAARTRPPIPRPERIDAPAEPPRRDFLFSTRRRGGAEKPATPPENAPADFSDSPGSIEPPLFDSAWPSSEPARPEPDFAPEPQPSRARPSRFPAPRHDEVPEVTVVKSGVVDTMAYSLYSDGSIEAQLPEGTVRFESIDELRAHLEQRG